MDLEKSNNANLPSADEERFWEAASRIFGKSNFESKENYSGRGMFGKKAPAALTTEVKPSSLEGKQFCRITGAWTDSLGLGWVYYLK
jgi:hypothetical protein